MKRGNWSIHGTLTNNNYNKKTKFINTQLTGLICSHNIWWCHRLGDMLVIPLYHVSSFEVYFKNLETIVH